MITNLFLALGLSVACGLFGITGNNNCDFHDSSNRDSDTLVHNEVLRYPVTQTIVSYQTGTYVDQYSQNVNYSGTNNVQSYYDVIANLTYDGQDWSYNNHLYDDGYGSRLFYISNGITMPSIVEGDVDEYGTYSTPSTNNYFLGLIKRNTSSGDITGIMLRSSSDSQEIASNMSGRDYFVNMRIFMTITGYQYDSNSNSYTYVLGDSYTILRPSWQWSGVMWSYDINFANNYYTSQCDFVQIHLSAIKTTDDDLTSAYNDGYDTGYNNGYQVGYDEGLNHTNFSFTQLFGAIADTPILMIRSLFGFDLFGINLLLVITSLVTGLIVFAIVKKFIK